MKKVLFLLLYITTLFSSCSSDSDSINNDVDSSINAKKYTVNLNVKSTGFEVDKTPMKSLTDSYTFMQIVAYKESGEAYSDTIIMPEQISEIISEEGSFPFSIELPQGNYHLAFIQRRYLKGGVLGYTVDMIKLKPENFYTDTYGGGMAGTILARNNDANVEDYYQSIEISVPNTSQDSTIDIVLEPMWSTVSISIENVIPPTGGNFMAIDLSPAYTRYNIWDKLAPYNWITHTYTIYGDNGFVAVKQGVNNGTAVAGLNVSKTTAENNNMVLIIKWYKDSSRTLLMTSQIDLKTQVENGQNYKISGKCSDILTGLGSSNLNITYAPFNEDEPVDLPF